MIDPVQIILFLVILVLTVLFVFLGVQVYFILRELRATISKTNKILDDIEKISEGISRPLSTLTSFSSGIKAGSVFAALKLLKGVIGKGKSHHSRKDDDGE